MRKAVEGEGGTTENLRNDKLANALLSIVDIDQVTNQNRLVSEAVSECRMVLQIPASLMEDQFIARFQSMLTDFKEQVCMYVCRFQGADFSALT